MSLQRLVAMMRRMREHAEESVVHLQAAQVVVTPEFIELEIPSDRAPGQVLVVKDLVAIGLSPELFEFDDAVVEKALIAGTTCEWVVLSKIRVIGRTVPDDDAVIVDDVEASTNDRRQSPFAVYPTYCDGALGPWLHTQEWLVIS